MFNKQKAKNTVKPSGQKAVGFRHFAKREFETNEICSHALKPKNTCSIFKIQSSDQGPDAFPNWSSGISKCVFSGQAEGQEMPEIIIVKLKSKTPLSLSHGPGNAENEPRHLPLNTNFQMSFAWKPQKNVSTHVGLRKYRRITSDGPKSIFLGHAGFGKFRRIFLEASKWAFSGQCLECGQWDSGRNH